MKVVLVTGSRHWTNRETVRRALEGCGPVDLVIEGGARGADRLAREEARAMGVHVATIEALWDYTGKGAGPRRNSVLVALVEALDATSLAECLAFPLPDSIGTWDCIKKAQKAGIPVFNYGSKEDDR